ncbi:MAG: type II secretion system F family protein [Actinobacteria bacterium]|nr:MAG: type II secretion system F family protein [Actinomycetota bacterium]
MTILLVIAVFCLAGAAFLLGEIVTLPSRQRFLSVRRAATYGRMEVPSGTPQEGLRERVIAPVGEWLARWALKVNPRSSTDAVSLKLMAAGMSRTMSPSGFLALKGLFALGGLFMGALIGSGRGFSGILMGSMVLGSLGFLGPDYFLTLKARGRRERVRADLPDALDLLAVSVEAGLGFDASLAKLNENMDGPLAEEFGLTLSEMRIGESRSEALKRLSERVDAQELSAFTRAIIQADQLGTSLGRILRVQAADARLRRQAAAEERAMKAPIKMLFPTVLFIFPAMFLVILGPAILNVQKLFG